MWEHILILHNMEYLLAFYKKISLDDLDISLVLFG